MSAHKLQLVLTEPAKQDFRDILSFTLQTWGEGQFDEYRRKIDGALHTIAENPDIGHKAWNAALPDRTPPNFLPCGAGDYHLHLPYPT